MLNRFEDGVPSLDNIRAAGINLVAVIVNRADGEKAASLLRQTHRPFLLSLLAKGTAGAGFMDLIGFGEVDKCVVLCILPGFRVEAVLDGLSQALKIEKAHRGIAFSVPLSGVAPPAKMHLSEERREHIGRRIEEGVEVLMGTIQHDLILAVVNEGHSEALVERARAAGAPGATLLSARHAGSEDAMKMLGLSFQAERDVVAILSPRAQKAAIIDALNGCLAEMPNAHGIVFALPVDHVSGLAEAKADSNP